MNPENIKSLSRGELIDHMVELLDEVDYLQQTLIDDQDVSYDLHNRLGNLIEDLEELK